MYHVTVYFSTKHLLLFVFNWQRQSRNCLNCSFIADQWLINWWKNIISLRALWRILLNDALYTFFNNTICPFDKKMPIYNHFTHFLTLFIYRSSCSWCPIHVWKLVLWGASVTERYRARPQTARARISNPVSGGQFHLNHPQEVLLAQFSLFVHKGGLKPDSFHFIFCSWCIC